eukprot:PhM_4_TR4936/c0_g1_i1/m.79803
MFGLQELRGRVVLASTSPRRRDLFTTHLRLDPIIIGSTFAEDFDKSTFASAAEYCAATSREKAKDVASRVMSPHEYQHVRLVVSGDSIVVDADGGILEKAETAEHAASMIRRLSGRHSRVITAVCIVVINRSDVDNPTMSFFEFHVETEVDFIDISEEHIAEYVAAEENWMGKAGAYGIQDVGALFVRGIRGDYYNVMGFPICRFAQEARKVLNDK